MYRTRTHTRAHAHVHARTQTHAGARRTHLHLLTLGRKHLLFARRRRPRRHIESDRRFTLAIVVALPSRTQRTHRPRAPTPDTSWRRRKTGRQRSVYDPPVNYPINRIEKRSTKQKTFFFSQKRPEKKTQPPFGRLIRGFSRGLFYRSVLFCFFFHSIFVFLSPVTLRRAKRGRRHRDGSHQVCGAPERRRYPLRIRFNGEYPAVLRHRRNTRPTRFISYC